LLTACKQYCHAAGATQGNIAYTQTVVTNAKNTQNMNIHLKLILGICLILSQVSFGQTLKTLGMDGKLKKTDHVLSDVITIIPAGKQVKIISGPVTGVYFVDYNWTNGYLNEIYFSTPSNSPSYSNPSNSSSYSTPKKWDEYNLFVFV
jgi:hypothetical protein